MNSPRKEQDDILVSSASMEGEKEHTKEFSKNKKTVLLALSDSLFYKNALNHALNISKRIEARLEILYVTKSDKNKSFLTNFSREVKKEGFKFSLFIKHGCVKKAILEYTEKRRDILFVIIGSAPELDIECRAEEKALFDAWRQLKCPLVVVSDEKKSPADI